MPFSIGESVGPYRIVERLGQGGMATVFKAYHPALDRYVAIKVLHPAFREEPNFLARFQREARIVAKLDHPNIVPIYDFSEHRGHPYLVMRFVEGDTLKARLAQSPLDLEETRRVMDAVGSALSYAHGEQILHRDIKPSNVILTPEGHIYLTDFGLARMAEAGESTLSRDMMVGTPQYISPEQAKGETDLDSRTDIYSLGVLLYELLVGRVPFQADTPYAVVHNHIFTPLPLPRSLNPDLAEPLERVLLKALAKDPDDRFQTIDQMVAGFRAALGLAPAEALPETIPAPPPTVALPVAPAARRRRWPWVVGAVGACMCLLVGFLGLRAIRQREQGGLPPDSDDPQQLMESAQRAWEEERPLAAVALYQQAVEIDPGLVPAYLQAGAILTKMGQVERAQELYDQGLEANPDDPQLHQRAAETAMLVGEWEEADRHVRWMLQEMQGDPLSHAYAALLGLAQGEPCRAVRPELDTAQRMSPDLPVVHYALALCHLQEGNRDLGRAELEYALTYDDPPLPPVLSVRAELTLSVLDLGLRGAVEQEFNELRPQIERVPEEDGLRETLMGMLEAARIAWEEGNQDGAMQMIGETRAWVRENRGAIGEMLAAQLDSQLHRILLLGIER